MEEAEDNVMSKDEFQKLEKKEGNKKKSGGLFGRKPEPAEGIRPSKGGDDIDVILMRVEKIDARIEMFENIRKATDERLSALSEEIGELRSAILEKEKRFDEMDGKFRKVTDIADEINPQKITKDIEKSEDEIIRMQSRVETIDTKYEDIRKSLKDMKSITDNIKDIKKIFDLSTQLDKKIAQIEEEKKEISRTAGKTETMFSEMNEKLRKFEKYREKIDFNEETIYELMKSVDAVEVRLDKFVKTDKLDELLQTVEDLKKETGARIDDIKDIMNRLLTDLKKSGMKDMLKELGDQRLRELEKNLESADTDKLVKMQMQLESQIKKLETNNRSQQIPQTPASGVTSSQQGSSLTRTLSSIMLSKKEVVQPPAPSQKYSYMPNEKRPVVPLPPSKWSSRSEDEIPSIPLPPKRAAPPGRIDEEEVGMDFEDEAEKFEDDAERRSLMSRRPDDDRFEEDGEEEEELEEIEENSKRSVPMPPASGQRQPTFPVNRERPGPEILRGNQNISRSIAGFSEEIKRMIMQGRVSEAKDMYQKFLVFYEGVKGQMSLEDYASVYKIMSEMNRIM